MDKIKNKFHYIYKLINFKHKSLIIKLFMYHQINLSLRFV
jgi:hypothetical protein